MITIPFDRQSFQNEFHPNGVEAHSHATRSLGRLLNEKVVADREVADSQQVGLISEGPTRLEAICSPT